MVNRSIIGFRCRAAYVLLVMVLLVAGCGGADGMYPVRGTVSYEGQPLDGGTILFNPVDASLPPARAAIQADGTYELKAVPGEYKIIVNWYAEAADPDLEPDDPRYVEPESLLPPEYSSLIATPLKGTVQAEETQIDLEL